MGRINSSIGPESFFTSYREMRKPGMKKAALYARNLGGVSAAVAAGC